MEVNKRAYSKFIYVVILYAEYLGEKIVFVWNISKKRKNLWNVRICMVCMPYAHVELSSD